MQLEKDFDNIRFQVRGRGGYLDAAIVFSLNEKLNNFNFVSFFSPNQIQEFVSLLDMAKNINNFVPQKYLNGKTAVISSYYSIELKEELGIISIELKTRGNASNVVLLWTGNSKEFNVDFANHFFGGIQELVKDTFNEFLDYRKFGRFVIYWEDKKDSFAPIKNKWIFLENGNEVDFAAIAKETALKYSENPKKVRYEIDSIHLRKAYAAQSNDCYEFLRKFVDFDTYYLEKSFLFDEWGQSKHVDYGTYPTVLGGGVYLNHDLVSSSEYIITHVYSNRDSFSKEFNIDAEKIHPIHGIKTDEFSYVSGRQTLAMLMGQDFADYYVDSNTNRLRFMDWAKKYWRELKNS